MTEYSFGASDARACNCIGPQNGDPLCPCMMQGVAVEDGRYVKRTDLGAIHDWPKPSRQPAAHGCICPPGAEKTCRGDLCPRRPIKDIIR